MASGDQPADELFIRDNWLTPKQAADRKGLEASQIREAADGGLIASARLSNNHRRIDPVSLDAYDPHEYVSVREAAERLDCSANRVRRLFDGGVIWGRTTKGKHRLIAVDSLPPARSS